MNFTSFSPSRFFALPFLLMLVCCVVSLEAWAQQRRSSARAVPARSVAARPLPRTSERISNRANDEEAMRLLKMGNTYREARNYDLAQKNINEGIERATRSGNRYWQATGYEYLGLVYRDMGDRQAALSALQRASDIFNEIIKSRSPRSSRNSTQMLLNNMMSDDASRLQPMPTQSGATDTRRTSLPSSMPPQSLRPRDLPPRTVPPSSLSAPSRANSPLEQERALNAQLTARLAALEERIRNLDNAQPSPGASLSRSPVGTSAAPPTSSNPPGAIARTMPPRPVGDKPQGEFAPFQTDKKPLPPPPVKRDTVRTVVKDSALPIFTLRVGIGAGYALNRPVMGIPSTIISPSTVPREFTGGSGGLSNFSFPMLSVSGDFYLSPQFSLGLMYGYFPGPNINDTTRITTGTGTQTTTDTTSRLLYTDYHFLTLRPAYHFVRNQTLDAYVGLPLGGMLSNFTPLRLYAGLLAGFQYNFTRQVGVFLEVSAGGHYTGRNGTELPTDVSAINGLTIDGGIINIGAFGRLGLAVNF